MFKVNLWISLFLVGLSFQQVSADDDTGSALQKTQDCLRYQNCDSANTGEGKTAEQKALEAVSGNASQSQELHNISADIMPFLIQQAGGEPTKMQAIMLKAQTDPESFLRSLPPEIQAKIKKVASAIEKNQTHSEGLNK
jgi:hypothetical protein